MDNAPRRIADRYELRAPLGRGGMGVVWLADDTTLQRRVAVKEVEFPPTLDARERDAARARVMREARAAARLNHPNVTTVFDVVQDEGRAWIVMELVEAPTLADLVARDGPLPPARAATIGLALLGGLESAHAQGIVHRDVKPGNVMVSDSGRVKLTDFGVAAVQGDPKITMTGLIVGSPSYMSPEQAREGQATAATDLWGLGATLYYAVEGTPPFDRGHTMATLNAVVHEPPRPVERAGALAPVVSRLLAKDPQLRPAGGELRALLEQVAAGATPAATRVLTAPPPPPPVPPRFADEHGDDWGPTPAQRPRSTPWAAILAGVAVLLLAGAAAAALGRGDDDRERRAAGAGEQGGGPVNAPRHGPTARDRAGRWRRRTRARRRAETERDDDRNAAPTAPPTTAPTTPPATAPATPDDAPTATVPPPEEDNADGDAEVVVPDDWQVFEIGDTGSTVAYPPAGRPGRPATTRPTSSTPRVAATCVSRSPTRRKTTRSPTGNSSPSRSAPATTTTPRSTFGR